MSRYWTDGMILKTLTRKVCGALDTPNCFHGSFILRKLLSDLGIPAEVAYVTVEKKGQQVLDEHYIVRCNGVMCDPTSFQIAEAPPYIVSNVDADGSCSIAGLRYEPNDSNGTALLQGQGFDYVKDALDNGYVGEEGVAMLVEVTQRIKLSLQDESHESGRES